MSANSDTPVDFRMIRDAGTMHFTGMFHDGDGVGRFTFEPNPAYAATLRSLGVPASDLDDDDDLFSLAIHDVSTRFIKEMQSLGYRENLDAVRRLPHPRRDAGVRARDQRARLPARDGDDLVAFRIHGATPAFIRDMRALGYQPTPTIWSPSASTASPPSSSKG